MIRTRVFPCSLPKDTADTLNRESGRIYTGVLVEHYRILRHSNHWLSPGSGEKLSDYLSGTILHAHSRDAAQQGFYKACKTARSQDEVSEKYDVTLKTIGAIGFSGMMHGHMAFDKDENQPAP